jgi:DNA-binding NtrC family response regulator
MHSHEPHTDEMPDARVADILGDGSGASRSVQSAAGNRGTARATEGVSVSSKPATDRGRLALDKIVGVSAWSRQLREDLARVARHASNVLILGPSGTGKELIARAIHANGPKADKAFIPVDCAVTTGTLFASHMFGHVKGSFTGAIASSLGCFRAADGGTIFLDEIGEMELEIQSKLLRVLQQRTVVPVGSHEEVPVNVRVLAATNRSLQTEVDEGRFREDLFYRLNVVVIETIPLKDRPEDIPLIASRYLAELSAQHGMAGCVLSDGAVDLLQQYSWPGNVRELQNVLERAVMFSSGDEIDPDAFASLASSGDVASGIDFARRSTETVEEEVSELERAARSGVVNPTLLTGVYRVPQRPRLEPEPQARGGVEPSASPMQAYSLDRESVLPPVVPGGDWPTLADVERLHLERTLSATMQNRSLAAKLLGVDRSVLRRKLQKHGLDSVE